jgi:hypothetical protein
MLEGKRSKIISLQTVRSVRAEAASSMAQSTSHEDASIQEGHFDILSPNVAAALSPPSSIQCSDASQPYAEPPTSSMVEFLNHRQHVSNPIRVDTNKQNPVDGSQVHI